MKEIEAVAEALDAVAKAAFYALGVVKQGEPLAAKQDDPGAVATITPSGPPAPVDDITQHTHGTATKKTGRKPPKKAG